ncbi:MAG: hypothetical protein SPK32_03380 [Bacteroidaceae bacterium]|nr:hypothetical protein [Bacteroidaceae bacterium]
MNLDAEIMMEIMQMTNAQKEEVLSFAKALRHKEDRSVSTMMETVVTENEEAFRELAE